MRFNNVLNGKKGFLDYQNVILTKLIETMSSFPKSLAHDFQQKLKNSSQSHFLGKISRHNV